MSKQNEMMAKALKEYMICQELGLPKRLTRTYVKLHPRTQEYIKWVFKYGVGILIPNDSPEMKRNCIETALRFEQSTGKTYAPSEPWINELNRAIDAQYGSIAERKRKFKLNKPKGETK